MRMTCYVDKCFPKSVAEAAKRRASMKFSRFADAIRELHITVVDINGPKGGLDTRCRLRLLTTNGNHIIIEETAGKVKDAITGACDRATRKVSRVLARNSDHFSRV